MWFVYIDEEDTESWNRDTRSPDSEFHRYKRGLREGAC